MAINPSTENSSSVYIALHHGLKKEYHPINKLKPANAGSGANKYQQAIVSPDLLPMRSVI
jgi:hypothetical protein